MASFSVNRATWLRGVGSAKSQLRNEDNMYCCLGQIALQCGIEDGHLLGLNCPNRAVLIRRQYRENLYAKIFTHMPKDHTSIQNSQLAKMAMQFNDEEEIDDTEREKLIAEVFERYGHKICFYTDYNERTL